ncbi:MAG: hypothetical protein ABI638_15005, partial [Ignavibacteriota bacterium]
PRPAIRGCARIIEHSKIILHFYHSIAKFIYNDKINGLLDEILTRGFKIAGLNSNIKLFNDHDSDSDEYKERKKLMKEKSELIKSSIELRNNLDEIFMGPLKIKN